jgi:hypothetical protein
MNVLPPLSNWCDLPPWEIASRDYNDNPRPLHIHGVRTAHRHFFSLLDRLGTWHERAKTCQPIGAINAALGIHACLPKNKDPKKTLLWTA